MTILITGAAGKVGRMLRERLDGPLRLVDVVPVEGGTTASVTDLAAMRAAARGVRAIVHLGGLSNEDTWERILAVNIDGTRTVLEAARLEGVPRVILASSNHAAGFHPAVPADLPADVPPRPDTYYGVSKAAMEALGSLYHDRFGMHVVCLRIGTCDERPSNTRSLGTWLSPDDVARLVRAALEAEGFHLVWGVSANTRRWWSLAAGEAIGYHPRDDAEAFADQVSAEAPETRVGGAFCRYPLGKPQ